MGHQRKRKTSKHWYRIWNSIMLMSLRKITNQMASLNHEYPSNELGSHSADRLLYGQLNQVNTTAQI
jgi:hypothetical protein